MTREKLISRELHQESSTDGHRGKTIFLEPEFQCKGNKQTKKRKFSAKFCSFSAATDSEIIIIHILHGKGQIKTRATHADANARL